MALRIALSIVVVGFLSSHALAQDDLSVVKAYKTSKAPEIDGVISDGEWDAAGPPIVVAPEELGTAFPEDEFGGPEDLSFQFRVMWEEPWTAYFLFEVTDDIAMEVIPGNRWEMDQVEFFADGDDLEGSDDLPTYQWWDNAEIYGKFGASRWEGDFEGNTNVMSTLFEDFYGEGGAATAVAVASETDNNADYIVEYAVSLEPMFDFGTFDGTPTAEAQEIVQDSTVIKWTACVSDDDDFGDGTVGRSHTACYFRAFPDADWRDSSAFADLTFVGEFTGTTPGDFNGDGVLDAQDADILVAESASGNNNAEFDLNGDQLVNQADVTTWAKDLANTWLGDADVNGEFNSGDLVSIFAAGKYEAGIDAVWSQGDWTGDLRFDSSDLVAAFADGGYEGGPRGAVSAVPEPTSLGLLLVGLLAMIGFRRAGR